MWPDRHCGQFDLAFARPLRRLVIRQSCYVSRVAWLAGVDGCKKGWFRICRNSRTGALAFDVLESASELISVTPCPALVGLDIPIGFPTSGAGECDRAARRVLGGRRNSVFPASVRAALAARDRQEASNITHSIDDRRVSAQASAFFRKIREVDDALKASSLVWEVHPEVSFWAWNGEQPMDDRCDKTTFAQVNAGRPFSLRETNALAARPATKCAGASPSRARRSITPNAATISPIDGARRGRASDESKNSSSLRP